MPVYTCPDMPGNQILREVVDRNNRPLCAMPEESVLQQKLLHRQAAFIIRNEKSELVLFWPRDGAITFSSIGILPFRASAQDHCAALLESDWDISRVCWRFLAAFPPLPENPDAFCSVYECVVKNINPSWLRRGAFSTHISELKILLKNNYSFDPFFKIFLEQCLFKETLNYAKIRDY